MADFFVGVAHCLCSEEKIREKQNFEVVDTQYEIKFSILST